MSGRPSSLRSPDRGLARLLNIWDNVREAVPDATLDIYYAWDLAKKLNPKMIADFEDRIDDRLVLDSLVFVPLLECHLVDAALLRDAHEILASRDQR